MENYNFARIEMCLHRHCVTHRGLQQLCTSYSLEAREYFFDRWTSARGLLSKKITTTTTTTTTTMTTHATTTHLNPDN